MAERLNARTIQMHDVESNWKLCDWFVPEKSEIIVYDIDENHPYPRFKIGDGKTPINQLGFAVDNILIEMFELNNGIGYIDSGYIG